MILNVYILNLCIILPGRCKTDVQFCIVVGSFELSRLKRIVFQFRRLQGKRNRGREEIKFLEIKGDDQLSGNKQWLTKNMTAEAEPRKSFSKVNTSSVHFLMALFV